MLWGEILSDGLRYERKYWVNDASAALLERRVAALLEPDRHSEGSYHVKNLYFDDQYDSAYREKLAGSAKRKKYRLRHYNDDFGFIRLECKEKLGQMIRKTSVSVTREQWETLKAGGLPEQRNRENPVWYDYTLLYNIKNLLPVLRLRYHRQAYVYVPGNVRVTFDRGLHAAPVKGRTEYRGFAPGQSVVELKYDHFLPEAVAVLFGGMELRESAVSKYVMAREALWKVWRYD